MTGLALAGAALTTEHCGAAAEAGGEAPAARRTGALATTLSPVAGQSTQCCARRARPRPGLPLVLFLHGGDGDNGFLAAFRAHHRGRLGGERAAALPGRPRPDADRSLYLDYRDGSQKWETFIVSELIPHLRAVYGLATGHEKTVVSGISMGGQGALRLGLKHPDLFGGVAALEAGIEPARCASLMWRAAQQLPARPAH